MLKRIEDRYGNFKEIATDFKLVIIITDPYFITDAQTLRQQIIL